MLLRALFAPFVVAGAAVLAGCPPPDVNPPPAPPEDLEVSASVAADAPVPDLDNAPAVDDILPTDVPDGVEVIDLGVLGIEGGVSGEITVDVKGLGAMTVLVYGQPGATVILERAVDPDGVAVVDDADNSAHLDAAHLAFARGFPAQVYSLNRVLGSVESGAFLVPNTPDVAPTSGKWKLRVGQFQVQVQASPPRRVALDEPVRVLLLVKGQDTGHGTLDLNLHFAGATSADDPVIAGALDVVRSTYAQAGIDLGEVRDADIGDEHATVTLLEGRCEGGDLDEIVKEGRGGARGVDLFFVDGFVCIVNGNVDVGSAIGGIAAGIPGLPLVHGSLHSGVVVSASFAAEAHPLGVVMAHEMGHFLGLYHTKESNVFGADPVFDVIADTPDDDNAENNLMYFAAQENTTLTEGQARVLRSSPFVVSD